MYKKTQSPVYCEEKRQGLGEGIQHKRLRAMIPTWKTKKRAFLGLWFLLLMDLQMAVVNAERTECTDSFSTDPCGCETGDWYSICCPMWHTFYACYFYDDNDVLYDSAYGELAGCSCGNPYYYMV